MLFVHNEIHPVETINFEKKKIQNLNDIFFPFFHRTIYVKKNRTIIYLLEIRDREKEKRTHFSCVDIDQLPSSHFFFNAKTF